MPGFFDADALSELVGQLFPHHEQSDRQPLQEGHGRHAHRQSQRGHHPPLGPAEALVALPSRVGGARVEPLCFTQTAPGHERSDKEAERTQEEQGQREPPEEPVVGRHHLLGSGVRRTDAGERVGHAHRRMGDLIRMGRHLA